MIGDDRDLYEYFAAARQEEEAQVPPIPALLRNANDPGRRRFPGRPVAITVCLAAMAATVVWLMVGSGIRYQRSNHRPEQTAASITSWKPGTDFLLNTPGRELLQGVPAIGEWRSAVTVPAPGERHHHLHKQVLP